MLLENTWKDYAGLILMTAWYPPQLPALLGGSMQILEKLFKNINTNWQNAALYEIHAQGDKTKFT